MGGRPSRPGARSRRAALAGAALLVAAAVALVLVLVLRQKSAPRDQSAGSLVVSTDATMGAISSAGGVWRRLGPSGTFFAISRPQVSPDGEAVAFGAQRCGNCTPALAVVPLHGGRIRRLFTSASEPDWSPDGRRIAFIYATPNGTRNGLLIYVVDSDGRHAREVEVERGREDEHEAVPIYHDPTFSPNGRLLAFVAETEPNEVEQIFLLDRSRGRVRQLTKGARASIEPAFSPDGHALAYACATATGTHDICLVGVDRRARRVVVRSAGDDREPVFSPAGTLLVFSSDLADRRHAFRSLYEVRRDGGPLRRLTFGYDASQPAFMPDGRLIVFVRRAISRVQPTRR